MRLVYYSSPYYYSPVPIYDLRAPQRLVEQGVKLVGIDHLPVEKLGAKDLEVHRELLSHEVIILEGLNLAHVPAGK